MNDWYKEPPFGRLSGFLLITGCFYFYTWYNYGMKILSLFDGYSTIQQACKNLGIKVDVCYASEIDPYAIAVTQSNFPETVQLGSVTDIRIGMSLDGVPHYEWGIDLIIGGSPCQDLSIAKKGREGLSGARSGLFWEYVRIRDEVKPKYFVLENVASMPKEAKDTISEALGVQPVMINASLVSAQNRKRLFWVGKWNGEKYEQVEIPQPEDRGILLKDIVETGENIVYQDTYKRMEGKPREHTDKCFTLTSAMGTGGGHVPYVLVPEATKKGYAIATEGMSIDLSFPNSKTRRGRVGNKVKNLMTSQNIGVFTQGIIRKLTPIECLRLQSMPDDYFDKALYKGKPISNSQRYKMCGNAFSCAVIEHILKHIDLK
jgi:DNA (cytosine-5)-methyltransferase 3A